MVSPISLQGLVPLGSVGIVLPVAIAGVMFANVNAAFGNAGGGRPQGDHTARSSACHL
jgi:hypothetical protein